MSGKAAESTRGGPRALVALLCLGLLVAPAATAATAVKGFGVAVATRPPASAGQSPIVVLAWTDVPAELALGEVDGYNVYRKIDPTALYPKNPHNPVPIRPLSACADIKKALGKPKKFVLPGGKISSFEWDLLEEALASPPPEGRFDPCQLPSITPQSQPEKYERLQLAAAGRWRIAVAIGQGFQDTSLVQGQPYFYELRALKKGGGEAVLASDIAVVAGLPEPVPPPVAVTTHPGDSQVLVTWAEQPAAVGFVVERSLSAAGPYLRVGQSGSVARFDEDPSGKPIQPARDGALDFQRWDQSGSPEPRLVGGLKVDGPWNGIEYFYRVAGIDLLGQRGPFSGPVAARAIDVTPPLPPDHVKVRPVETAPGVWSLEVRWRRVDFDERGHLELVASAVPLSVGNGVAKFRVLRFETTGPQGGVEVQKTGAFQHGQEFMSVMDDAPILTPKYGTKKFWYRVESEDLAGNRSALSAAAAGELPDVTPPGSPGGLAAEGFDEHIVVSWKPSVEPDVVQYELYRGVCHLGQVTAFFDSDSGVVSLGDFVLVGSLPHQQAVADGALIEDRTVPKGSPLCYAYLVKALDGATNLSGSWPLDPFVGPALEDPFVCQRLRDKKLPAPPIITALRARDGAVLVEWIGPPVPDIRAYYVHRAASEHGPWPFVGGRTVANSSASPPIPSELLTAPLAKPATVGCDQISGAALDEFGHGTFLDRGAVGPALDPRATNWYRVTGVDWAGNETLLEQVAPVSTFSFASAGPAAPSIIAIAPREGPSGLLVRWQPQFDAGTHLGFAVLRAPGAGGPFRQIGSLVSGASEYLDTHVLRGATYHYRVVRFDLNGSSSAPSTARAGVLP